MLQMVADVADLRAYLCDGAAKLVARYAEFLAPVAHLMVLLDVDAGVVGLAGLLQIVSHRTSSMRSRQDSNPYAQGRRGGMPTGTRYESVGAAAGSARWL